MSLEKASSGVKVRLLEAALRVIRAKGYSGTTVDDLCAAAGVTKGGFFHHFKSKEDLAVGAAHYFGAKANELFGHAAYQRLMDPLDRVLGYVELRKAMARGELPEYTCLLGTMVQETYETHPAIRAACEACIWGTAAMLQADIEEAIRTYGVHGSWTAESLALHTQAVIQGAFVLAKAKGGGDEGIRVVSDQIDHLHRYLQLLFNRAARAA